MSGRPPRVQRVNQAIREVIADELELIDDDRLQLLTITGIGADPDFRRATVWFASMKDSAEGAHEDDLEVLGEHRVRLQAAIARQLQLKRTPELRFAPDPARAAATRVEDILRSLGLADSAGTTATSVTTAGSATADSEGAGE